MLHVADLLLLAVAADSNPYKTPSAKGVVTLVRQDIYADYEPALIFQTKDGDIAYLTRSDDRWWLPWRGVHIASGWPVMRNYTVFASDYTGSEFLGTDNGELTCGYRDNIGDWHDPLSVLIRDDSVTGVVGRPGFFQYPVYSAKSENPQFMALVPLKNGGIGLYERKEASQRDWGNGSWGVIAQGLRPIAAVVVAKPDDGTLQAVLRIGSRLYALHHPRGSLPHDLGKNWTVPSVLNIFENEDLSATGDPALTSLTQPSTGATELLLAVPVINGIDLLDTMGTTSNTWRIQRLPAHGKIDSVSLLVGNVEGREDIDVTYRSGNSLLYTWRWLDGRWHQPALVQWHN